MTQWQTVTHQLLYLLELSLTLEAGTQSSIFSYPNQLALVSGNLPVL